MGRNVYKTARGQIVDLDTMRLVNESVVAVGNMSVNARGDEVAPDGSIIKTRNEIMKDRYKDIQPVVRYNPNKNRQANNEPGLPDPNAAPTEDAAALDETSSVRGSLASTVAIDLVETPPVLNLKNLTRI